MENPIEGSEFQLGDKVNLGRESFLGVSHGDNPIDFSTQFKLFRAGTILGTITNISPIRSIIFNKTNFVVEIQTPDKGIISTSTENLIKPTKQ